MKSVFIDCRTIFSEIPTSPSSIFNTERREKRRVTVVPTHVTLIPARLTTIPTHLTTILCRLTAIPTRVTVVHTRIRTIPTHLMAIPTRLTAIHARLTAIRKRLTGVRECVIIAVSRSKFNGKRAMSAFLRRAGTAEGVVACLWAEFAV